MSSGQEEEEKEEEKEADALSQSESWLAVQSCVEVVPLVDKVVSGTLFLCGKDVSFKTACCYMY